MTAGNRPAGRYRWTVVALLFASTTICYIDRQLLGLLKPMLERDLHWSETVYGDIVATFSILYAIGYLIGGRLIDAIGVRRGLALAVGGWSVSAAAHGLVASVLGFKIVRGALGLAEGGNFPASIKAIREWFPPQERALATGIFNAGSNIGAVLTPIALPFVVAAFGWRAAFMIAGALGLVWLAAWLRWYDRPDRQHRLSAEERAYVEAGDTGDRTAVPWRATLRYRGTWAYVVGMLMTSPVWWFYLNWVPGFLHDRFGVDMKGAVGPIVLIYLVADIGSVAGGWLSSRLVGRGVAPVRARIGAMLALALLALPVAAVPGAGGIWTAAGLIALAAAAHQGISANLYTLVSDAVPAGAVSSVVGIGGFAAGLAGMVVAMAIGRILDASGGDYRLLFIGAACAYPFAVLMMALILRRQRSPSCVP